MLKIIPINELVENFILRLYVYRIENFANGTKSVTERVNRDTTKIYVQTETLIETKYL